MRCFGVRIPAAQEGLGGGTGAGGRSVHDHARGPHRGSRSRAAAGDAVRTVIAGYHWFTDWGRDTMISLEGLTLTTGRHARGRLDPAHVRLLRARRPDPQHVPGRRERRACITRPMRRCGSSTRSTAISRSTNDRATLTLILPKLVEIVRSSSRRHALRDRCRSARRPASAGRSGLSAHLDGREGGRLGGDAAPRQGGGDQCALVQRAAAAGGMAAVQPRAGMTTPTNSEAHAERARGVVQRALLVRRGRIPVRRRRCRRRRQRSRVPAEPVARDLARSIPVLDPVPLGARSCRSRRSGC